jgi:hypothetical protein
VLAFHQAIAACTLQINHFGWNFNKYIKHKRYCKAGSFSNKFCRFIAAGARSMSLFKGKKTLLAYLVRIV